MSGNSKSTSSCIKHILFKITLQLYQSLACRN
jgi:hypothetical protein